MKQPYWNHDLLPGNINEIRRAQRRFQNHAAARDTLELFGVNRHATEYFQLGLASATPESTAKGSLGVLEFPLMSVLGTPLRKRGYGDLDGLATNPPGKDFRTSGLPRSYISGPIAGCRSVIVVSDPMDVWQIWAVCRSVLDKKGILLLSSTHSTKFPGEWQNQIFWQKFERVLFAVSLRHRLYSEVGKIAECISTADVRVLERASSSYDSLGYICLELHEQNAEQADARFEALINLAPLIPRIQSRG
jgi:hypothetical protein